MVCRCPGKEDVLPGVSEVNHLEKCPSCGEAREEASLAARNDRKRPFEEEHEILSQEEPPVEHKVRKMSSGSEVRSLTVEKAGVLNNEDTSQSLISPELSSLDQVWKLFGLSPSRRKKLPSRSARQQGAVNASSPGWRVLSRCVADATICISKVLYPGDHNALAGAAAETLIGQHRANQELEHAAKTIAEAHLHSKKGSTQRRVISALLVKAFPLGTLDKLRKLGRLKMSTGLRGKAYQDYNRMASGEELTSAKYSRIRYDEDVLRKAVKFILSSSNVGKVSMGTRTIKLSSAEEHTLPRLIRRKPRKDIYQAYIESTETPLSSGTFYNLVKLLTVSSSGAPKSIDDVICGLLVLDPVAQLQRIIDELIPTEEKREELTDRLESMCYFLKSEFKTHCINERGNTGQCAQLLEFSLQNPPGETGGTSDQETYRCVPCSFVQHVLGSLQRELETCAQKNQESRAVEALEVLRYSQKRFEGYQSHVLQVVNQNRAVRAQLASFASSCQETSNHALITVAWKTNLEPIGPPTPGSKNHFGSKELLWQKCMVTYFRQKPEIQGSDGEQVDLYFDQIVEKETVVDAASRVSLLETLLEGLTKQLPSITSAVLSVSTYEMGSIAEFVTMVSLLNTKSSIRIERVIQSGSPVGWQQMSAHLRASVAHIVRFMQVSSPVTIRAILTPRGLAAALAWNGGQPNSCVQLVRLDKEKLQFLKNAVKCAKQQVDRYSPAVPTMVDFSPLTEPISLNTIEDIKSAEFAGHRFELKFHSFYSIGKPAVCQFTLGTEGVVSRLEPGVSDTLHMADDVPLLSSAGFPQQWYGDMANAVGRCSSQEDTDLGSENTKEVKSSIEEATGGPEDFIWIPNSNVASSVFLLDCQVDGSDDAEEEKEVIVVEDDIEEEHSNLPCIEQHTRRHLLTLVEGAPIYGPSGIDPSTLLTGATIVKCSEIGRIEVRHEGPTRAKPCSNQLASLEDSGQPAAEPRRDIPSTAIRLATEMVAASKLKLGFQALFQEVAASQSQIAGHSMGWARGSPIEVVYKESYLDGVLPVINESFELGWASSGCAPEPLHVLRVLQRRFPRCFKLPGLCEIQVKLHSLWREKLRSDSGQGSALHVTSMGKRGPKSKVPSAIVSFMQTIMDKAPDTKPRQVLKLLSDSIGVAQTEDGKPLSDAQLRNKWNTLKATQKTLAAKTHT